MTDSPTEAEKFLTLAQLAEMVAGRLEGDARQPVRGVAAIEEAGPDEIAFLSAKRYARYASRSNAGAFLVTEELEDQIPEGRGRVVVADTHAALASVLRHFHPETRSAAGIHPTAVLEAGVRLGEDVGIGPYAVLLEGAEIGAGTRIGAHTVVGPRATIGQSCTLHPHVVVYADSVLGDRVILHSGARVGSDGFGYAFAGGEHQKMPHVGRCILEDDVEIGANTAVDRGSVGDTLIEAGVKVDNLVHIAHNARVGPLSMIAGTAGLAGSARLGAGVYMGGRSGVVNHAHVGDGARLAAEALVVSDVPPGVTVSGNPARPHKEELQRQAHVSRLPKLMERVKALEKEVRELKRSAAQ